MKKIISVVGARPNFIKIAPLHKAFLKYKNQINHLICHTGQHFDKNMSKVFFEELEMPRPDFYLGISEGTHAGQTANIMIEFEKVLQKEKPDLIIVPGDVNSTMACSLVASKLGIKIAHVESGLRSFDRTMPEEINRIVTDILSDYLFVTEKSGIENLKKEGIDISKIFFVGNIMIDSLSHYISKIDKSDILNKLNLNPGNFILVTFHRPSNVDSFEYLESLQNFLNKIGEQKKIVFPVHPRTQKKLTEYNLNSKFSENVIISGPIGYLDFLHLEKNANLVITDSGGIQEETTFLGVQCITVRENTERPITVEIGTNHLCGTNLDKVYNTSTEILNSEIKKGKIPEMWDGHTSERITKIIIEAL